MFYLFSISALQCLKYIQSDLATRARLYLNIFRGQIRGQLYLKNKIFIFIILLGYLYGGPRRIRTPDPLIRSQVLYPAELSVHTEGIKVCNALMQEQI